MTTNLKSQVLILLFAMTLPALAEDNKRLTVQWNAVAGAVEYRVYSSTGTDRPRWTNVTTGTSLTLSNLTDRPWVVSVVSVNNRGEFAQVAPATTVRRIEGTSTNTVTGANTALASWTTRGVTTCYTLTPTTNTLSFR